MTRVLLLCILAFLAFGSVQAICNYAQTALYQASWDPWGNMGESSITGYLNRIPCFNSLGLCSNPYSGAMWRDGFDLNGETRHNNFFNPRDSNSIFLSSKRECIKGDAEVITDIKFFDQSCRNGWISPPSNNGNLDLNANAGGAYIYLCYKTGRADQVTSFVRDIGIFGPTEADLQAPVGYDYISMDLNDGAGGDYIYFAYKTTVYDATGDSSSFCGTDNTCKCSPGRYGPLCQYQTCANYCNGKGYCDASSGKCYGCETGYGGDACADINECQAGTRTELGTFICKNVPGDYYALRLTGVTKPINTNGNGATVSYALSSIGSKGKFAKLTPDPNGASLSSTLGVPAYYPASNAIDGNKANFAHSDYGAGQWLEVKFTTGAVTKIVITNRQDSCCQFRLGNGFNVFLSYGAFASKSAPVLIQNGVWNRHLTGIQSEYIILLDYAVKADRILIVQDTEEYLNIAEVEAFYSPTILDGVNTWIKDTASGLTYGPQNYLGAKTLTLTAVLGIKSYKFGVADGGPSYLSDDSFAVPWGDGFCTWNCGSQSRCVVVANVGHCECQNGWTDKVQITAVAMSSLWSPVVFLPALAIDGDPNTLAATSLQAQPWFDVTLPSTAVTRIIITNRQDCCKDRMNPFYVFLKVGDFVGSSISALVTESAWSVQITKTEDVYRIDLPAAVTATKLRIQLDSPSQYLNFAEVEVFSTPNPAPAAGCNSALGIYLWNNNKNLDAGNVKPYMYTAQNTLNQRWDIKPSTKFPGFVSIMSVFTNTCLSGDVAGSYDGRYPSPTLKSCDSNDAFQLWKLTAIGFTNTGGMIENQYKNEYLIINKGNSLCLDSDTTVPLQPLPLIPTPFLTNLYGITIASQIWTVKTNI